MNKKTRCKHTEFHYRKGRLPLITTNIIQAMSLSNAELLIPSKFMIDFDITLKFELDLT